MNQQPLTDLLAARAKLRELRKNAADKRAAYDQAKSEVTAAAAAMEKVFSEIEQQQGRLFEDDAPSTNGRAKKPARAAARSSV